MKLISLIVPVLNEEEAIPLFYDAVQDVLHDEPYDVEILFIDDGSTDRTLEIIEGLHARDPRVRGISFSRNFGKELALAAGLQAARGDAVVPMDVDLQDPPALLKQFLRRWEQGYEMVIGVRARRDADSWAKRVSAGLFYRLFSRLTRGRVVANAGDYRLMDRVVVDALNALPERVRFTKGLYGWVGFRSAIVAYERPARVAGSSKWPGWKLWNFALDGITSFSTLRNKVRVFSCKIGMKQRAALCSDAESVLACLCAIRCGTDIPSGCRGLSGRKISTRGQGRAPGGWKSGAVQAFGNL